MKNIFLLICILIISFGLGACRTDKPAAQPADFFLLEDSSLQWSPEQAWEFFIQGKFQRQVTSSFNPGFTSSYYWLVVHKDTAETDLKLEIGTSQVNQIDFYEVIGRKPVKILTTGDHYPFASRPEPSRSFILPLAKMRTHYLLKIDKVNESLQLTFRVLPALNFQQMAIETSIVIGLFSGAVVLMLIFGLYLALITRERVYLFYILYIASGWLYVLANLGYGYQYFWPEQPWLAAMARPIFALLTIGFSLNFLRHYAGDAPYPWLDLTLRILAIVSYLMVVLAFLPGIDLKSTTPGYYFQAVIPVLVAIYLAAVLTTLIQKIRMGNRMAMFYLLSIAPIAIFSTLQVSYYSGGVDFSGSYLQHYGQATGYALEAVILTFGLAYRFNNYRKEKERLLVNLNQQQVRYARAIITTQESERRQIADQLHDVAGSLLSAARLNLSAVREKQLITDEDAKAKLGQAEDAVFSISEMLRNLSHAISAVMLDKVGFKQSVEKIAGIFNTSGKLKVEAEVLGFETHDPELHEKYSVLYGILYELVNNVAKHARASHALVQLIEHEESIVLMVEDNGRGLDKAAAQLSQTHGLAAIQSKIHYLNGTIAFDDAEPSGLIVTIEIPKKSNDKNYSGG
jgi:two-component system, sensor histidine kinase LadS